MKTGIALLALLLIILGMALAIAGVYLLWGLPHALLVGAFYACVGGALLLRGVGRL